MGWVFRFYISVSVENPEGSSIFLPVVNVAVRIPDMETQIFNSSGVQLEQSKTWVPPSTSQSLLDRVIPELFMGWSNWQYILTFMLGVIVYDQGKCE